MILGSSLLLGDIKASILLQLYGWRTVPTFIPVRWVREPLAVLVDDLGGCPVLNDVIVLSLKGVPPGAVVHGLWLHGAMHVMVQDRLDEIGVRQVRSEGLQAA